MIKIRPSAGERNAGADMQRSNNNISNERQKKILTEQKKTNAIIINCSDDESALGADGEEN